MEDLDVEMINCGSAVQFYLFTDRAREWVAENVNTNPWQWRGNCTFVVEYGYGSNLATKMVKEGLNLGLGV